jgi:hypothetical protein
MEYAFGAPQQGIDAAAAAAGLLLYGIPAVFVGFLCAGAPPGALPPPCAHAASRGRRGKYKKRKAVCWEERRDDLSARDFIRRYKVSKSIFEIICNTIREDIGPAPRPPTSCTRRGRGRPRKILAEHKVRVT